MLVVWLWGVNCRVWSHLGCLGWLNHYICPFRYRLDHTEISRRGQFKLEPHPHWSPLGVNLNFPTSIPVTFIWDSPPQGWGGFCIDLAYIPKPLVITRKNTLTFISSTLFALAKQSKNLGAYKMARTAYDKLQVREPSLKKSRKSAKSGNSFSWGSENNSTLWKYKAEWFYLFFFSFYLCSHWRSLNVFKNPLT